MAICKVCGSDGVVEQTNILSRRYQVLVGLLFAVMEVPHAWCMLMHKFVSVPVDHW